MSEKIVIREKKTCPACNGRGKSYGMRYCGRCKGRNKVTEKTTVEIPDNMASNVGIEEAIRRAL